MVSGRVNVAFRMAARGLAAESPLYGFLAERLGAHDGDVEAISAVYDKYTRILSTMEFPLPLFLAGLHRLALAGGAPQVARFYPSCGGSFDPARVADLAAAVDADVRDGLDDVLDFMLSRTPVADDPQRAIPVLLGMLAAVDRFGGGVSLVELGCGGGLSLLADRYAYRLGTVALGDGRPVLSADLADPAGAVARLAAACQIPAVVGRAGLDESPRDLTDPEELAAVAAFIPPDQAERRARLLEAAAATSETAVELRAGNAAFDLAPLLVEAYNRMPPGNTLLLCNVLAWHDLGDDEKRRAALAVQQLAAQLQPQKPLAWLQAEPPTPGSDRLELKLSTFGWADMEDRAVRRLAEADLRLGQVRWLE